MVVQRAIAQDEEGVREKDTKTHQRRHIALDPETVAVMSEHRKRCAERASAVGAELEGPAFVFSAVPDGSTHLLPSSVSQRYLRLAKRLGIKTTLHKLRHYSATELITGGVDIRTVAGRLGHGGGGVTTLRVYSAWVLESDQRAATSRFDRMPARPDGQLEASERAKAEPRSPYERIAVDYREQILGGSLRAGEELPPLKQLSEQYGVSIGTAHRAVALLASWGMANSSTGKRTVVLPVIEKNPPLSLPGESVPVAETAGSTLLDLEVRRLGKVVDRSWLRPIRATPKHCARSWPPPSGGMEALSRK
jgi:hypothetical protein